MQNTTHEAAGVVAVGAASRVAVLLTGQPTICGCHVIRLVDEQYCTDCGSIGANPRYSNVPRALRINSRAAFRSTRQRQGVRCSRLGATALIEDIHRGAHGDIRVATVSPAPITGKF